MNDLTSLTQALKTASLEEIFEQVVAQVKEHPQNLKLREALFKLYCIDGAWEKALLQLETLALLEDGREKQTELYKSLVFSEMQRVQVLHGERQAATLHGDTPLWMQKLHDANVQQYHGDVQQAEILRYEAFDLADETAGQSAQLGQFSWIADSDGRLGPVCEFICAGGYRWVPFAALQQLRVSLPEQLLDLLWVPATIKTGEEIYHGFIPARYPVEKQEAQELKLGFKTEWSQLSDIFSPGSGRKVIITNLNEHSIMEVGDIVFG